MAESFEFSHEKFLEMFTRTCECGSKTFRLALEDLDMVPLRLPAEQRVTCTECGRYSFQTVSAEVDPPEGKKPKKGKKP